MVRTLITLSNEDKKWLERYSAEHRQSMAETIRMALKEFRKKEQSNYQDLLQETAGLWKDKNIDGLKYVDQLRDEWKK